MVTHQLTTDSSSEKAWHIAALLLSLGRPARPDEVASRCTLFEATPDLIQSICLAPNSPISQTNDLRVTLSLTALQYLAGFVAKSFSIVDASKLQIEPWSCSGDLMRLIYRKQKRLLYDDSDCTEEPSPKRIRNASTQVHYHIADGISTSVYTQQSYMPVNFNQVMFKSPLFFKFGSGQFSCKLMDIVHGQREVDMDMIAKRMVPKILMASQSDSESALPARLLDHDMHLNSCLNVNATFNLEDVKQNNISSVEGVILNEASKATNVEIIECQEVIEGKEEDQSIDLGERTENIFPLYDSAPINMPPEAESELKMINTMMYDDNNLSLDKDPNDTCEDIRAISRGTELPVADKQLRKPSAKTKIIHRAGTDQKLRALSKSLCHNKAHITPQGKQHCKIDHMSVSVTQKAKQNHNDLLTNDQEGISNSISQKDQQKQKVLPNFESYIVEEEEGSGGYGTVYRARRKNDGTIVAIKCPHANANRHHINNELRMLERFGGKNFIIKYQGCFKSENSDCFVLEHVDHDRPEVLKKEIDITQLQWYGYCMFRALASLHKQEIVHRDVKPGNFLFSRKATKGYLIDFNLAMDLQQKYGTTNKSKAVGDASFSHVTLPSSSHRPPTNSRKVPSAKPSEAVKQEATKGCKSTLELTNLKRKAAAGKMRAFNDLGRNIINSQGAEGSGITSTKDVTSTRTPSAERLREPLPCQGRKELISLLHEARRRPNHEALHFPSPMRKRIAAPPGKVDREPVYLSPMPLHSSSNVVAAAALMKNKGNGKNKREGPCAGTKGFRAPEVLFRSQHQGPKLDIWSAGVTLLYLMIGRTPFFGDPEQNIKDIAKLRGSEDLWEVAKLHNRESSFPEDLYGSQYLAPINLRDWCRMNTKKQDFLEIIPSSLFDLVDKCLMVNPRLRLSAEDALKHEFFAPCHEILKKQKLLRQGLMLDNRASKVKVSQ